MHLHAVNYDQNMIETLKIDCTENKFLKVSVLHIYHSMANHGLGISEVLLLFYIRTFALFPNLKLIVPYKLRNEFKLDCAILQLFAQISSHLKRNG